MSVGETLNFLSVLIRLIWMQWTCRQCQTVRDPPSVSGVITVISVLSIYTHTPVSLRHMHNCRIFKKEYYRVKRQRCGRGNTSEEKRNSHAREIDTGNQTTSLRIYYTDLPKLVHELLNLIQLCVIRKPFLQFNIHTCVYVCVCVKRGQYIKS